MNPDPEDVWSSNILITKNITTVVNLWLQTIVDLLQGYPNQNLGFYLIWWFVTTASENWQTPVLYDENQDYVCQIRVPNTIVPTNVFVMCDVSVVIYDMCHFVCLFVKTVYILSIVFNFWHFSKRIRTDRPIVCKYMYDCHM